MNRTAQIIRATVVAIATATVLTVIAAAAGAARTSGPPALQQALAQLVAAGAPGAILLTRDGSRTTRLTSGLADVDMKTPMRADDRFRIASLTKTFVAAIVLQLVDEQKLSLNDSVQHFLPGLVANGTRITIRQLLNHTSGFPEYDEDARVLKPYLSGRLGYYWPPRRLIAIALSHERLFEPGARYSYANTNYLLLGLIVEKATGHPLATELRRRIFGPLHLRATSFPTTPRLPNPYAHGYFVLGKPPAADVSALSPSFAGAAGGIVSTVDDVASFYRLLLSGRLLERSGLDAMQDTVAEPGAVDLNSRYGLGIERYTTRCGTAWGHGGAFPGYLVYAFTSSDGRRQAVLMVNQSAESLPKRFAPLYFRLLTGAYCQRQP
jgi:D-alanyl-D-alanine carboxypeptidase